MKPTVLISVIVTLSALVTFAAAPFTAKRQFGPNRLTEDKAAIERTLKAENAKLDAVTEKLASKLQKPEAKALVKAQASWATWRAAEAEYLAHRYAPTEASSPDVLKVAFDAIKSSMEIEITEKRIKQLDGELSSR
ncbi:MAG: hypothetical protein JWL59_126 [Chthoniobacteraceae bacterium]|nr:hypothetical protein [Chthoniobacteraceae bacterium]